ncbi:hypothetical protein [Arthrobacter sp. H14-L1]|uniref:hypothetical protein n=1 Tax=Arthrobacter sp. H14-L1 TaxID=2996697 RepID=UPI00226DA747|nr:hypothetical protein [Arthrobacter sp. H14-L1]MCY0903880.1 hypothetical protein [Arthrobacter sp. H14-L1]
MDTTTVIWIIVVVIVVLIILGLLFSLGRRRKVAANRQHAGELRESAENDAFRARESEAKAARADADAKEAEINAEKLRREASQRQEHAQTARSRTDEQLREADRLDPDVASNRRRATPETTTSARNPAEHTADGSERLDERPGRHQLPPEATESEDRHQE